MTGLARKKSTQPERDVECAMQALQSGESGSMVIEALDSALFTSDASLRGCVEKQIKVVLKSPRNRSVSSTSHCGGKNTKAPEVRVCLQFLCSVDAPIPPPPNPRQK